MNEELIKIKNLLLLAHDPPEKDNKYVVKTKEELSRQYLIAAIGRVTQLIE